MCFIKLINGTPPLGGYPIVSDAVLVTMVEFSAANQDIKCPVVDADGGVSGEPTGAGGAVDSGSGGSDGGMGGAEMGGAGVGGVGGMTGIGGTGGGDAGGDKPGEAGDSGADGCDDAGHETAVDAQKCEQPPDPLQPQIPVTPTTACIDYCNRIVGSSDGGVPLCSGSYESVDQCQQYCTRAAWIDGTSNDQDNSMSCRMYDVGFAQMFRTLLPATAAMYCDGAGPSGGAPGGVNPCGTSKAGGMCKTFCDAWAKICPPGDATACLTACQGQPSGASACRFPWLLRAAVDPRYCATVDFAASCVPPGC